MKSRLPSPGLVVAVVALVVAMTGAAIALPGKNSVKSNDIAKNAVTSKKIKKNAVTSKKIKKQAVTGAKLADGAVGSEQIADGAVGFAKLDGIQAFGERVVATEAVSEAAALAAAPKIPLAAFGDLSFYGKCVRDTTAGEISGYVFAETSVNGALLDTDGADLPANNDALLLTTTPEADRELDDDRTAAANAGSVSESESMAVTPDGQALQIATNISVKQGTLAATGNGAFGDGNVCIIGGLITG